MSLRVAVRLFAAAVVLSAAPAYAQREGLRPEIRGVIKSINGSEITIAGEGREGAAEKTFKLGKEVEVAIGSGGGGRAGAMKEGKVADLTSGIRVALGLSANQQTVESILAENPTLRGQVKSVDAGAKTITISLFPTSREAAGEEKTLVVAADAEIGVDDGRGRRFSAREASLADIIQGSLVTASLSMDMKTVHMLVAEGPTVFGTVKSIDPAKKSITLAPQPFRGDAGEERSLTVADNATIVLDDGRGRRLSIKEAGLADIPVGAGVAVRLSPDQTLAMSLRAEGPTLVGMLKAVDADKGTLVLAVPKGRGEQPEEKTFTVAKDARININGADSQLGELKTTDDGPFVQLRLTLDQGRVQSILARTQPR